MGLVLEVAASWQRAERISPRWPGQELMGMLGPAQKVASCRLVHLGDASMLVYKMHENGPIAESTLLAVLGLRPALCSPDKVS